MSVSECFTERNLNASLNWRILNWRELVTLFFHHHLQAILFSIYLAAIVRVAEVPSQARAEAFPVQASHAR
jgi:hypothetical protein